VDLEFGNDKRVETLAEAQAKRLLCLRRRAVRGCCMPISTPWCWSGVAMVAVDIASKRDFSASPPRFPTEPLRPIAHGPRASRVASSVACGGDFARRWRAGRLKKGLIVDRETANLACGAGARDPEPARARHRGHGAAGLGAERSQLQPIAHGSCGERSIGQAPEHERGSRLGRRTSQWKAGFNRRQHFGGTRSIEASRDDRAGAFPVPRLNRSHTQCGASA